MSEEIKEMGEPSARITKISKGGRVWITRKYPKSGIVNLQGHFNMLLYVNDRIKTEENTFANFEFWTGGQIGLNKHTEVEIVGINRVEQINMPFNRKVESYLRINKKSDPLQIRTAAGVMGVKG